MGGLGVTPIFSHRFCTNVVNGPGGQWGRLKSPPPVASTLTMITICGSYRSAAVSNTLIRTPSEISRELWHNHEIDHWCVIIRCKQNMEVGAVFGFVLECLKCSLKCMKIVKHRSDLHILFTANDNTPMINHFVVKKSKSVDAVNKKLDAKETRRELYEV